jgi:lipopolysaccharide/colanic/teichoic acid biosynthesis glycosyltransferase
LDCADGIVFDDGEKAVNNSVNGMQQGAHTMNGSHPVPAYLTLKAWPTRIVGAILLIVASPVILTLVMLVRCTSRGPGLYRQTRTGRHGKEFTMYKIRTMYIDAESVTGPTWSVPGDSRITLVGRILRLLHLDELPQLINVARGDMDLIGPRPERPQFVKWLASEIPGYRERWRVLPGVTGLAQINLPPDETLESVRKKLALDCLYIDSAGLGLDLRILICTFLRMLGIRHGRAVRWLGLTYDVDSAALAGDVVPNGQSKWTEPLSYRPNGKSIIEEAGVAMAAIATGNGNGDELWSTGATGTFGTRPAPQRPPR